MRSQELEDEQLIRPRPEDELGDPLTWKERLFLVAVLLWTMLWLYVVIRGMFLALRELWRML
jgi:hypothetical protein